MDIQPWMDRVAFRAALPALSSFGQDLPPEVEQYRQFYGLNFKIPHKYHIGTFQSEQFILVGQIFQPSSPNGTLFVYHGYFDHLGLYGLAIQIGLELGMTVVGFDLPGHGLSSGPAASIDCFSRYAVAQRRFIEEIKALNSAVVPRKWSALGQSTGAAVIIDSVLEAKHYDIHENYYDGGLVFLAPLIRPSNWYWVRFLYHLLRHRGGIPRKFSINSTNQSFCEFLSHSDPLQHRVIEAAWVGAMIRYTKRISKASGCSISPLVVQGTADSTVAFPYNLKKLHHLFQNPKIVMLEGARHHLVNESNEYQKVIRTTIKDYLK